LRPVKHVMRRAFLLASIAVLCACGTGSEQPTNNQAVQAGVQPQRNEASNAVVNCDDCGPPVLDANGQVIPQG
jgi:hypothetical protein